MTRSDVALSFFDFFLTDCRYLQCVVITGKSMSVFSNAYLLTYIFIYLQNSFYIQKLINDRRLVLLGIDEICGFGVTSSELLRISKLTFIPYLKFEGLSNPLYSPSLTPSDYYVFDSLKNCATFQGVDN